MIHESFCDQLRHWREQYEQRTGGTRGVKAHFLTNRFYLDPHIEMSYQEWCTTEQLPPSRVLLLVMVSGLVLYQGYSALKTKQPAVWVGFAFRIGATVALALIVVALYFIRIAQKYWKYLHLILHQLSTIQTMPLDELQHQHMIRHRDTIYMPMYQLNLYYLNIQLDYNHLVLLMIFHLQLYVTVELLEGQLNCCSCYLYFDPKH